MKKKALRLKVDLEISRISCPGVFFQCKGPDTGDGTTKVLATFETSVCELLFPNPSLLECSGVDADLLMEPTVHFPGVISPKIEASTQIGIEETRTPHSDKVRDAGHIVEGQPPPIHLHPHLGEKNEEFMQEKLRSRNKFVWRKPDEDLIIRRPKLHTIWKSKSADDVSNLRPSTRQKPLLPRMNYSCLKRSKSCGFNLNQMEDFSRSSESLQFASEGQRFPPGRIKRTSSHSNYIHEPEFISPPSYNPQYSPPSRRACTPPPPQHHRRPRTPSPPVAPPGMYYYPPPPQPGPAHPPHMLNPPSLPQYPPPFHIEQLPPWHVEEYPPPQQYPPPPAPGCHPPSPGQPYHPPTPGHPYHPTPPAPTCHPPHEDWRRKQPLHYPSLPPSPPPVDYPPHPPPPVISHRRPEKSQCCSGNTCDSNLPKPDTPTMTSSSAYANSSSDCRQQCKQSSSCHCDSTNSRRKKQGRYKPERYSGKPKNLPHDCCCVNQKKFEPKKWSTSALPCCDFATNSPSCKIGSCEMKPPSCKIGTCNILTPSCKIGSCDLQAPSCLPKPLDLPCIDKIEKRVANNSCCDSRVVGNGCKLSASFSCLVDPCNFETHGCYNH